MSNQTEQTQKKRQAASGFYTLLFILALLFVLWLVMGQLIPRFFLPLTTHTVRQELGIVPTKSQPLRRQSFNDLLEAQDTQLAQLRDQLAQMEAHLQSLETLPAAEGAAASGPNGAETPQPQAQPNAQSQAQSSALAQALAEAQSEIAALKTLSSEAQAASKETIRAMQGKIGQLETQLSKTEEQQAHIAHIESQLGQQKALIEEVRADMAGSQMQTIRQLSALSAFIPLKEAIMRGQPFDAPLTHMLNFTYGNRKVEALAGQLRPIAGDGTLSLAALQGEFNALLLQALARSGSDGGFLSNLRSLISIRKTGEQLGESDEAVFARAEARLNKGDVDACLAQLEQLSPESTGIMKPWVEKARRYLLIRSLVNDLQMALTQPPFDSGILPAEAEKTPPAAAAPEAPPETPATPPAPPPAESPPNSPLKEKAVKPAAGSPAQKAAAPVPDKRITDKEIKAPPGDKTPSNHENPFRYPGQ